jgi:hypothetical protein
MNFTLDTLDALDALDGLDALDFKLFFITHSLTHSHLLFLEGPSPININFLVDQNFPQRTNII